MADKNLSALEANLGTIATQNANAVAITGGTIGGVDIAGGVVPLVGGVGESPNGYQSNNQAGFGSFYIFSAGGLKRWILLQNSVAESGGNAGSNFRIDRYDDAGNYLQTALEVIRSSGQVNANGNWGFSGATTTTGLATFNGNINTAIISNLSTINTGASNLNLFGGATGYAQTINNFTGLDAARFGLDIRCGSATDGTFMRFSSGNATAFTRFGQNAGGIWIDRRLMLGPQAGGAASAAASQLHLDEGTATASAIKLTAGATTGVTATDGFELGITTTGAGEIRQRENLAVNFYTTNTLRMSISNTGTVSMVNGVNVGSGTTVNTIRKASTPVTTIIAANESFDVNIAVAGAATVISDMVFATIGSPNPPAELVIASAFVSATNVCTVRLLNISATPVNLTGLQISACLIKF